MAYQYYYCSVCRGAKFLNMLDHEDDFVPTCSHCGIQAVMSNTCPKTVPKTQKAKGLEVLKGLGLGYSIPVTWRLFQSIEEVTNITTWPPMWGKVFARPCPVRPRHGFVDSRVVSSKDELLVVMQETKEADPDGEVMLMPLIDAKYNAIWTPSLLTIGLGNDGATAGKDVLTFPLCGINPSFMKSEKYATAGVGEKEDPYIEVVQSTDSKIFLTQLRAGPKGDSRADFIPRSTTVKEVLVPNKMDLLVWENLIKEKKDVEGVVVCNVGGSPCDHYSVHGRSFNIPVITSRDVVVGMELDPIPFQPMDPFSVLKGLAAADSMKLAVKDGKEAVYALLLALHGNAKMEADQGKWLGMGVGLLLRLGSAAIRGEARHINQNHGERSAVYARCFPHTIRRHRAALPRLINILRYGDFGGGGIGGRAWAECGGALATLFDAVGILARTKDAEGVNALLRAFNTAVNQAHNGGWWLNKFASADCFNLIQVGQINYPIACMEFLWDYEKVYKELSMDEIDRKVAHWEQWQPIDLKHGTLQGVEIGVIPGLPGISFTFTDRLLKGKHRPMVVPAKEIFDRITAAAGGEVYVVPTSDGLSVEFRRKGMAPVRLWKEKGVKDVASNAALKSKG